MARIGDGDQRLGTGMHIEVAQVGEAVLADDAVRIDAGQATTPQAHGVRALANDTGHRVGHMAQHVHGGMGVDVTYPIHRFLYWSRALAVALGGTEHHLAALGDWLADNDNLGWKYDLAEDELPAAQL